MWKSRGIPSIPKVEILQDNSFSVIGLWFALTGHYGKEKSGSVPSEVLKKFSKNRLHEQNLE